MKKIILVLLLILVSQNLLQAQCYPDRHSTNWYDGWVSCQKTTNPNSSHGITHWIKYDLGSIYSLSTTQIWNANDPSTLNNGINTLLVDYSIDGTNWTNLGTYTIDQATGKSTYEGTDGPDFDNLLARYVLLTPTTNYGGSCYGFSEMKINIGDEVLAIDPAIGFNAVAFPNPFDEIIEIRVATLYPDKPIDYTITDLLGRTLLSDRVVEVTGVNTFSLTNSSLNLSTGIYILSIYHNNQQQSIKIVKE